MVYRWKRINYLLIPDVILHELINYGLRVVAGTLVPTYYGFRAVACRFVPINYSFRVLADTLVPINYYKANFT